MKLLSLLLRLALVLPLPALAASAPMFGFTGGSEASGDQTYTYGFRFEATTDITVDSLGFYDADSDGLSAGHRVGIWDPSGHLLASTSVTTANSTLLGPMVNGGQFRYTTISDLNLTSGTTYVFGAAIEGAGDTWYFNGANLSPSSLVNVSADGYFGESSFVDPALTIASHYHPGSFTARESTAVPEPASIALIGLGLLGAATARRKPAKK